MSLRVAQASGRGAQCTQSALVCPRRSGTGHSRLSLLCRVLAVGRKCAFGATIGIAVKLNPNPGENPQTCSKRDLNRSRRLWGRGVAHGADDGSQGRRSRCCGRGAARSGCGGVLPTIDRGRAASLNHSNHVKIQKYSSTKFCSAQEDPAFRPSAEAPREVRGGANCTISRNEARACPHFGCPSRRRRSDLVVSDSFCGDRTGSGRRFQ